MQLFPLLLRLGACGLMFWLQVTVSFAQPGKVLEAEMFLQVGNLPAAKATIDRAIQHSASKTKDRAWKVFGDVYQAIAQSGDAELLGEVPDAQSQAIQAYQQSIRLADEDREYVSVCEDALRGIWASVMQEGVEAYQGGDLSRAIAAFDQAKLALPQDTTAYLYAGVVAQSMERFDLVLSNFRSLTDLDYQSREVYASIIFYSQAYERDTAAALVWAQKARQAYPDDPDFHKQEINLLIQLDRLDKARTGLEQAISREPDNANLYFNLGFMYETSQQLELAIGHYQRAVELDPDYYDPVYNLAALHYNQAAERYAEIDRLPEHGDLAAAEELQRRALASLRLAMPYMETAAELQPDQPGVWNALFNIYERLGDEEKAGQAYERYQALIGGR